MRESLIQWMLDADFSEDECGLLSENGQKTLNIFRKLALQLHKNYMQHTGYKPQQIVVYMCD